MISKAYGNARSYPNFKDVYCPGICLEGLEQITRNLRQDFHSRVQESNPGSPEYDEEGGFHVLSTELLNTFRSHFILIKHGGSTPFN